MSATHTPRGFRIFVNDDDAPITVLESSLAFEGPHVRVSGGRRIDNEGGRGKLHLSLDQAKLAHEGLGRFIAEAEGKLLTEPPHIKPEADA